MAKDKALTKIELVKTLKEIGVATKADVRQIVGEEISSRKLVSRNDLKNFSTKNDLKNFSTKNDLKNFATKEDLKNFATKEDLKNFATKDDLKNFPTKDDLKTELNKSEKRLERRLVVRMNKMGRNLQQSIADLAETTPTRQEFEILKHSGNYGLA